MVLLCYFWEGLSTGTFYCWWLSIFSTLALPLKVTFPGKQFTPMFTTGPQLQVLHQPFLTVCNMHMTTSICLWRACLMITTLRLPCAFLWLTTESQRRKMIISYILDCKFWLLLFNWYWLLSEASNSLLRDLWSVSPLCAVSFLITQSHSYFHNHIRSYNRRYLISFRLAANDNPIEAVFELLQFLKFNVCYRSFLCSTISDSH